MQQKLHFLCANVNIGSRIKEVLQIKGISKAELSRVLNMNQSNLNKLLNKFSIETSKLVEISKALKYNFFKDFCVEDGTYHDIFRNEEGLEINFEIIDVNIGKLVDTRIKELGLTQKEVADRISEVQVRMVDDITSFIKDRKKVEHTFGQQYVSTISKRGSIDTLILFYICHALKYNFFECFVGKEIDPKNISSKESVSIEKDRVLETWAPFLKRNEELVAENTRLKDYLREVYSKMQKIKEDNGISIDNWEALVKTEGVDIMKMASFFSLEAHIKRMLDESDQADPSNKKEKDE